MSQPIGVVTGLTVEADILRPLQTAGRIRLGVAGADAARARALAERFADEGVAGLVSFGICGGLVAEVKVGDLVLADAVRHPDGGEVAIDPTWRAKMAAALAHGSFARRIVVREGPLVGSAVLVEKPVDKAALHAAFGAIAVDMESHAVAQVAAERGLPLLILRTCSDAAHRAFPLAALEAMNPDGSFRPWPVFKSLARKPQILPPILRLALESRRALVTLERVSRAEAALLQRG